MMGGSIASSIKNNNVTDNIIGYDINPNTLRYSMKNKFIDEVDDNNFLKLKKSDFIIICTPLSAYNDIFKIIKKYSPLKCLITDIGSTKVEVTDTAKKIFKNTDRIFIGSHPLAGKEKSGIKYANKDLFTGARVIITFENNNKSKIVKNFWSNLGAKISIMSPKTHDLIVSKTSHVPHLLSYALVNTILKEKNIKNLNDFTGGGFKDFARIALSDPLMWKDISSTNKKNIIKSLDVLSNEFKLLKSMINKKNFKSLHRYFKNIKDKLS